MLAIARATRDQNHLDSEGLESACQALVHSATCCGLHRSPSIAPSACAERQVLKRWAKRRSFMGWGRSQMSDIAAIT